MMFISDVLGTRDQIVEHGSFDVSNPR